MGEWKPPNWEYGNFFAVPITDGYGFGRIIDLSTIGIYEFTSGDPVEPARLDTVPMLFFCHFDRESIASGEWPIIGHAALEDRLIGVVEFAIQIPGKEGAVRWRSNSLHVRVAPEVERVGVEWYRWHDASLVRQRIENRFSEFSCPIKAALTFDPNRIPPPPPAEPERKPEFIDIFDHDAAAVWTNELVDGYSVEPIARAFRDVIDREAFLGTDEAASAVAAGEVLAAAKGRPGWGMPSHLPPWIERWRARILELKVENLAEQALRRVCDDSELNEQWSEVGMRKIFTRMIDDLLARLK